MSRAPSRSLLGLLLLGLVGCSLIKVNANYKGVTNINGQESKVEWKFEGTLDELPAALAGAYDALSETRAQLVEAFEKIKELPPPGQVKLSHLSKSLQKYESRTDLDFLDPAALGRSGQQFTYVRLGVPTYDNFFRAAMEFYALTWQTTQAAHRLREVAAALLKEEVDETGALFDLVARAVKVDVTPSNQALRSTLDQGRELVVVLAKLLPAFIDKTQQLVSAGQALVAGAAGSLTHPKVVLNLDAVKQGLEESVTVVSESAGLLKDTTAALAGF